MHIREKALLYNPLRLLRVIDECRANTNIYKEG